jgi:hypothetical protein
VDQLIELIVRNLGHYLYPGFRIQICHNGGELDFGGNLYGGSFRQTHQPTCTLMRTTTCCCSTSQGTKI